MQPVNEQPWLPDLQAKQSARTEPEVVEWRALEPPIAGQGQILAEATTIL
jgi:hypothetical protein